jgi:hypothetical protein
MRARHWSNRHGERTSRSVGTTTAAARYYFHLENGQSLLDDTGARYCRRPERSSGSKRRYVEGPASRYTGARFKGRADIRRFGPSVAILPGKSENSHSKGATSATATSSLLSLFFLEFSERLFSRLGRTLTGLGPLCVCYFLLFRGPPFQCAHPIDYNIFIRNAGLTQNDFSNPCGWPKKVSPKVGSAHGHFTQIGGRMIGRHLVRYFT